MKTTVALMDLLSDADPEIVRNTLSHLDGVSRESVRAALIGKKVENCVVSFSGGIDSSILAVLCNSEIALELFSLCGAGSQDARFLKASGDFENLGSHFIETVSKKEIESAAKRVSQTIEARSLSQVEDCTAFYLIASKLRLRSKDVKFVLTANGPDELFCGYDRFRRLVDSLGFDVVEEEMERSLQAALLLKQDVRTVLEEFDISTLDPFLLDGFTELCRRIPAQLKIKRGEDRLRKRLWRLYGRSLGLPESIVLRPKKAMQYSMGIHQTVFKMLKRGEIADLPFLSVNSN